MLGETLHILSAVCLFISNIMQKPPNLNLMKLGEVQREQSRNSQNMVWVQIKERVLELL